MSDSQEKPDLMQTMKERLATIRNGDAVVNIYPDDPNRASIVFKDSKGLVRAELTTKGNSYSLQFDGATEMDPHRVKDFHGRVGQVFGNKQLTVGSSDVTYGSRGHAMTTRLQPEQIATAQDQALHQRAQVSGTIKAFHEQETMKAKGYDPKLVDAQTNHSLARLDAPSDARSLLTAKPADSPMQAQVRAAQSEFAALLQNTKGPAPVKPAPHVPSPEFTALLNKPFNPPAEHAPHTPHAAAAPHAPAAPRVSGASVVGGLPAKLAVGAVTMAGAGIAAAAQAPEGQRVEAGVKASVKAGKEYVAPGSTETDICKATGNAGAWVGGFAAGTATTIAIATGTVVTAGAGTPLAVVAGPTAVLAAGGAGAGVGQLLGEGGCKLVRAAYNAISPENRTQMAHKPEAGAAPTKTPDALPKVAQTHGTAASRG